MAEIFEISPPVAPPGIPELARRRLEKLGPGNAFTRKEAADVCGSPSSANLFLDEAKSNGWIVPAGWGSYRVPDVQTLHTVGRIANPTFARFVAWARTLQAPRLAYAGPRIWRDTALNEARPMPVRVLRPDESAVEGSPAKWRAFIMDVETLEAWEIRMAGETLATFHVPGVLDSAVLLSAAVAPRWRDAAHGLPGVDAEAVDDRMRRLRVVGRSPGEDRVQRLGVGPPTAVRLVVPTWFWRMRSDALEIQGRMAARGGGVDG